MSRFVIPLLGAISLILGSHGTLAHGDPSPDDTMAAQYLHAGTDGGGPEFGIAVNTWHNESSHATDLVVTFGYKRKHDKGWAAIGLGGSMVSSLMFMIYGGQKSGDELIISVREAREYSEPRPSPDLPQVEMRALSWSNSSHWLETSFICFGCEDWAAKRRAGIVQPFIWAINEQDDVLNATVQSEVTLHRYTGKFTLDMSRTEALELFGAPVMPPINPTRLNQPDRADEVNIYTALVPVHGTLLGLAMLVLYPCGIISIRVMPHRILIYLCFQVLATASCAMGAAAVVSIVMATGWVNMFKEPHALLGMLVLLLIMPQLFLGYVMRNNSTTLRDLGRMKNIHLWLGRVILFGGCINTIVGLEFRGFSTGAVVVASLAAMLNFIVILLPPRLLQWTKKDVEQQSSGYDAVPLLDDSLELESSIESTYNKISKI